MSALPRPDLPPGPQRDLVAALHELHHRDGWRSLRALAREIGVSHTTVSKALSSTTLPSWGVLELLVEAMGGDSATFHEWWLAASSPARDAGGPAAPIAGRRAELDVVRRHLESGSGLLLVTGEAGMGKTTVLETSFAQVRDTVLVAAGRCLPLSSEVPLLPVAEAMRRVDHVEDGRVVAAALEGCPAYVREALSTLLPEWSTAGSTPEVDDRWLRQRMFAAVAELCRALSQQRSFALALEDLHWADELTLDLVEHLVQHAGARVLGSWRTDDPDVLAGHREWFGRVRRDAAVLPLRPLTEDQTLEQIRLIRPAVTAADASRIYARSLGQPLFTEQLTQADAGEPTFLGDLLDGRVGHLTGLDWTVAAVLGIADRRLSPSEVARAADVDEQQLTDVLRGLRAERLVDVDATGVQLRHPLLAEAVRRRLLPGETAAVHRAVAATLAAGPAPEPAEVARHWRGAADAEEELAWQVRAARAAEKRYAGAQAAEHWHRALVLWPPGAAEAGLAAVRRYEVVAGIAAQLDLGGRPGDAIPVLEAELARPDSPHLYDASERADLLCQLARYNSSHVVTGDRGLRLVEQAIELYRTVSPSAGLVAALLWKGIELEWQGRRNDATLVLAEAAQAAMDAGDRQLERTVRAQWAWQLTVAGHLEGVDEVERLAREFDPDPNLLRNVFVAVRHTDILLMACRRADEVLRAAAPTLEQATRWRVTENHANVLFSNVAQALRRAGRVGEAIEGLRAETEGVEPETLPLLHVQRAILEVLLGHKEEAWRRLDALDLGRHQVVDTSILEARLMHTAWFGEAARGLELARSVLLGRHDEVSPGTAGDILVLTARTAADAAITGEVSEREAVGRGLDELRATMHHDPFARQAVLADRACLPQWNAERQRLLGRDTIEAWAGAATTWRSLNRPHDEAYCQWRAAEVALRDGRGTTAARLLRQATAGAREHAPLTEAIVRTASGT